MALYYPVADQKDGSYMTITSDSGIQFMFIFFLSGLSQMLVSPFREAIDPKYPSGVV